MSGAAPIASETLEFFLALGLPVGELWGMSEMFGGTLNPPERMKLGTVGPTMPGVELRVAEDGELLIKAEAIMRGYRNEPEKTAEAIDADGWLHTGDIGEIDDDGYVTIVDRKKELIISAGGKNMSPANIENTIKAECGLVGSVIAIGDRRAVQRRADHARPRCSARARARRRGGTRRGRVRGAARATRGCARVEQIKKYKILPGEWQPGGEELHADDEAQAQADRREVRRGHRCALRMTRSAPTTDAPTPVLRAASLCEAFQLTAAAHPEQVALRTPGGATEMTFAQYAARVQSIAAGLAACGVRRGDTVALMLVNRPEFHLCDSAAVHLGAAAFSVYNTLAVEQLSYVFANARNRVVICEQEFLASVLAASRDSSVEHVVCVDADGPDTISLAQLEAGGDPAFDFEAAWRAVESDDVLTLIYTSGTTGPPKGVELTHAGVLSQLNAVASVLDFQAGDRTVSFLPSAHAADRLLCHWPGMAYGIEVTSVADPKAIAAALLDVRPTIFGSVPRLWEKIAASFRAAGVDDPRALPDEAKAALRAKVGLENLRWAASGAAPIPVEVLEFFAALGLPICEVWGMSELSGIGTINPPARIKVGTVGPAVPGLELRAGRRRRAALPRADRDARVSRRAPEDRRGDRRRGLAAHWGHRRDRRRRLCEDRRSQEGADHQRGRQEHVAGEHRERDQGLLRADRLGGRDRRPPPVQRRADHARSRCACGTRARRRDGAR